MSDPHPQEFQDDLPVRPPELFQVAVVLEGGLAVAALVVGWLVGIWPVIGVSFLASDAWQQAQMVLIGVVATLPMLAGLMVLERLPWGPVVRLRRLVSQQLAPLFRGLSLAALAAISLLAGVGEELLFRGLLQTGLAAIWGEPLGPWLALAAASAVFGVLHWISGTYALWATMFGVYLGLLLMATGNILAPIVAHGLYDFLALWYLTRQIPPDAAE